MKKYLLLSAVALMSLGTFTSCDNDSSGSSYNDNDTYSTVYDITASFAKGTDGIYAISRAFNNSIPSTDVVLVYRLKEVKNGLNVWQQIPRTLYLDQGELDYDFDFTRSDIKIMAGGNYDISTTPSYLTNQTFRIVFVPAAAGKNANVDYTDYYSVIKFYGISDLNVPKLK